ncbi:hypothetical protein GGR56DRAFT_143825 [Xylariaceae sp. FL0804]|nr:hypothetical protein GGR56DRAFT_143825 [Xylariaceae sp. FL0804]
MKSGTSVGKFEAHSHLLRTPVLLGVSHSHLQPILLSSAMPGAPSRPMTKCLLPSETSPRRHVVDGSHLVRGSSHTPAIMPCWIEHANVCHPIFLSSKRNGLCPPTIKDECAEFAENCRMLTTTLRWPLRCLSIDEGYPSLERAKTATRASLQENEFCLSPTSRLLWWMTWLDNACCLLQRAPAPILRCPRKTQRDERQDRPSSSYVCTPMACCSYF